MYVILAVIVFDKTSNKLRNIYKSMSELRVGVWYYLWQYFSLNRCTLRNVARSFWKMYKCDLQFNSSLLIWIVEWGAGIYINGLLFSMLLNLYQFGNLLFNKTIILNPLFSVYPYVLSYLERVCKECHHLHWILLLVSCFCVLWKVLCLASCSLLSWNLIIL